MSLRLLFVFSLWALLLAPRLAAAAATTTSSPQSTKLPARQRVRDAKSYYCYYGPDHLDELAKFDVVILHTPAATPKLVRELKQRRVVTIGYISCGEDETLRTGDGMSLEAQAFDRFDDPANVVRGRRGIHDDQHRGAIICK